MNMKLRKTMQAAVFVTGVCLVLFSGGSPFQHAAPVHISKWSVPVNMESINSMFSDFAPHLSRNGRSLYFTSTRPDSSGVEDLWVSQRAHPDAPWGPPVNLGAVVNSTFNDRSPELSRDGHYLFFASDRPGGSGGFDIWVSWRQNARDDFGWGPPVNLGATINSSSTDAGPSFLEDDDSGFPQLYLASNRAGGPGGLDIYVSQMTTGGPVCGILFGAPVLVTELNTAQLDLTPEVRHDGREIIIASNRPGSVGNQDLWSALRETVNDVWATPVNLGSVVNSLFDENFPSLSSNRKTLFFSSNRPGGLGESDIYFSQRTVGPNPGSGEE
jgi:Tol biopolymer transport system component